MLWLVVRESTLIQAGRLLSKSRHRRPNAPKKQNKTAAYDHKLGDRRLGNNRNLKIC